LAKSTINKRVLSDGEKRGSFMGSAFKLGTELVAAVAVGTIIGFILDTWFDTKPWLMIIFFFLGSAAGMLNVIRTANRMQKED
jgi:ATP synthase protein I